jgi:hypothetical protein
MENLNNLLNKSIHYEQTKKENQRLKMLTKLTDFTVEELVFQYQINRKMYEEVTLRMVKLEDLFQDETLLHSCETYHALQKEQTMVSDFMSQLYLAIDIVKNRETVTSN